MVVMIAMSCISLFNVIMFFGFSDEPVKFNTNSANKGVTQSMLKIPTDEVK